MEEEIIDTTILYNYVFHCNPFTNKVYGIPREEYVPYFNGTAKGVVEGDTFNETYMKILNQE